MLFVFYLVLSWLEKINLTTFGGDWFDYNGSNGILFASAIIIYKLEKQKRQSTWPGIIAHLLFNGLGFIGLMVIMLGS